MPGNQKRICSECESYFEEEQIAALGHIKGEVQVVKEADCTHTGLEASKCTRCGANVEEREIAALGHNKGSFSVTKAADCTNAGTEIAKCTRCGDVVEERSIAALGHSYGTPVVVDATCTKTGSSTVTCATCGGTNTTVLAANGHDLEPDVAEHSFIYDGSQQMVGVTCMQFCRIDTCDDVIATETTFTIREDGSYWCNNCGGNIPY